MPGIDLSAHTPRTGSQTAGRSSLRGGDPNGHQLVNRSDGAGRFPVVGTPQPEDRVSCPDIDMQARTGHGRGHFTRRDGSAFDGEGR